jgi:hypothetical protein
VVAPDAIPQVGDRLVHSLPDGAQGDMDWLARAPERRADPGVLIERSAKIGVESFDPCDVATTNVVAGPARHSSTPTTVRNWALAVCGEVARIAAKAPKRYEPNIRGLAIREPQITAPQPPPLASLPPSKMAFASFVSATTMAAFEKTRLGPFPNCVCANALGKSAIGMI